ncbi:hypothetical protein P9D47_02670 [Bacillus haynesii]|uniref:hypothetical protein n=1 Tax=Bacillus haynesii TaxID=1925021 RepID=UPI001593CFA9|nr:hypothetical protein [Bacillus haynesii]MCY7778422.1 hypothetical protein [Bacillus haynesii]MEC0669373.1 hypothetical protein [Bacillus haynesii]MEC1466953.1 hypothetical protein [Bacillus haynesii]NVB32572.1 hypothetical protein [Bacillus licheniformis]
MPDGSPYGKRYQSVSPVRQMKNKRLFILSLIVLSVVMIGVQETFPNPLTTGLMTVVIAVAVFNIIKESLNKKDETHSK